MKREHESTESTQSFYLRLRALSPDQRELLRAAASPVKRPRTTGRYVLFAVAAGVAAVAIAFGVWAVLERPPQTMVYSAPADRHREVRLPDGSSMALGAQAITSVSYAPRKRQLEVLQGTAYFEVKHDRERPFVVQAGEVSVTAIGTAFSVVRTADKLSVAVTEGSVDVTRTWREEGAAALSTATHRVSAGERRSFGIGAPALPTERQHAGTEDGWQDGSMRFHNARLGDVIAAVNVYADTPIVLEDPRVADLNYSGTVFRDRIGEWIEALPRVYPVRNVALSDGTLTVVMK